MPVSPEETRMNKAVYIIASAIILSGCGAPAVVHHDACPDPPVLYSKTHSSGEWSGNPVAVIEWKAIKKEIRGYAIMINKNPLFEVQPLVNLDPEVSKFTTQTLPDGSSYFHIGVIGFDGCAGKTAHYRIQVCAETPGAPVVISPTHPEGVPKKSVSPKFVWNEGGPCIKGYYYSLSKNEHTGPQHFVTHHGIEFKNINPGTYTFLVQGMSNSGKKGAVSKYVIVVE
jgi:hypothetical protein